jgi:hypothetical protein
MYLTSRKPDQPVASPGSSRRPRPISPDKPPEEQQRVLTASFSIQATPHPARIPQEVAGNRRRHPRIPATEGSKGYLTEVVSRN